MLNWHAIQHTKALLQATASGGLAQGPYVAATVRFEPATFQTQGTKPVTEPWRPTSKLLVNLMDSRNSVFSESNFTSDVGSHGLTQSINQEVESSNPRQGRNIITDFCSICFLSQLTDIHLWKDETTREQWPPAAETKKMKSQTLPAHVCLKTSLRDSLLLLLLLLLPLPPPPPPPPSSSSSSSSSSPITLPHPNSSVWPFLSFQASSGQVGSANGECDSHV